jgi:hypothetical protein
MTERERQNVKSPATYSTALNENDIRNKENANDHADSDEQLSSFNLFKNLMSDWWLSSNSAEYHLKAIRRKVITMFSKCIWTMKIIRIVFRLMSNNLLHIDQQQGDRSAAHPNCISKEFQAAVQISINNFLLTNCEMVEKSKWILWSSTDDIVVGYNWYTRKMLIAETLLTLKALPYMVDERIGKKLTKQ